MDAELVERMLKAVEPFVEAVRFDKKNNRWRCHVGAPTPDEWVNLRKTALELKLKVAERETENEAKIINLQTKTLLKNRELKS